MKRVLTLGVLAILIAAVSPTVWAQTKPAYNFGDFRSSTLTTKAWGALAEKNLEGVLAYTNKCLEMYEQNARKMQAELKDYPVGEDQKIFSFWALNDIATSLYIQGEAYRQAGQDDKAKIAFEKVVKDFTFGQAWDPDQKAFWKPAEAAKDKLAILDSGLDVDFGDMKSSTIVTKAWGALNAKDFKVAQVYVDKVVALYGEKAKEMQAGLTEYPWESNEKIFSYWALNDIGTAYFIQGEIYRMQDKKEEAVAAYQKLINEYFYAQCWDTQGWFWKPAEAAQQKLIELDVPEAAAAK